MNSRICGMLEPFRFQTSLMIQNYVKADIFAGLF